MLFSVLYSSNVVCITPRFDAILSEKCGRGFSRFYFHGIKASAEEREHNLNVIMIFMCFGVMYSVESYICCVTLSLYPHRARLKIFSPEYITPTHIKVYKCNFNENCVYCMYFQ